MRILVLALALAAAGSGVIVCGEQRPARAAAGITYDEFIELPLDARRERFQQLAGDNKALILRTHAERWLAANRSRLSRQQVAVAEEAIAFVTPQIYRPPIDPAVVKQQEILRQKLTCVLGVENTRQAFVFDLPASPTDARTWRSTIAEWVWWFEECVVR